ncbi:TolC family protein [Aquimarina brevivitae]|uniref:Outer membrane protein TolC n=1 Tax=Aquimarina brevivitae TaxID=323412 RepID=A0A4Q7PHC3_9FLAO|nr:TolC family protein [Aquimarina brevivitae]RZS99795.1 outer membrane protein TolC [Aquimarina brevivitae]
MKSTLNIKFGIIAIFFLLASEMLQSQTLAELKEEAIQNNPEIEAARVAVLMSEEKVNEAVTLPDTNISIGYFVSEPETRTGPQTARFSAAQKLPWFGTIKAKKDMFNTAIAIEQNKLEVVQRKVVLKIAQKYYQLYSIQAKLIVLQKQLELIGVYKEIALSKLSVNEASALDILKLTMAQNNLKKKEEVLKGEKITKEAEMNQLLDRDGFDPLIIPNNLVIPDEEPTLIVEDITYHPELLTYEVMQEVVSQKKQLNHKESLPSLGLGLDYVIVSERTDMNLPENGKDVVMPMVSFSIPLFSKKYKSLDKQYDLETENLNQQKSLAQNNLEEILEKTINTRITARIDYDTQVENSTQAQEAEKIIRATYEAGEVEFTELLEIQDLMLDIEMNKIEAITTYFIQTAILNYLR